MHLQYKHSWVWLFGALLVVSCCFENSHNITLIYKLILKLTNAAVAIRIQMTHFSGIVFAWNLVASAFKPLFHWVFILFCLPPEALLCISLACDRGTRSTRPFKKTSLFSQVTKWLIFEVVPDTCLHYSMTSHQPLCQICTFLGGPNCSKQASRALKATHRELTFNVSKTSAATVFHIEQWSPKCLGWMTFKTEIRYN